MNFLNTLTRMTKRFKRLFIVVGVVIALILVSFVMASPQGLISSLGNFQGGGGTPVASGPQTSPDTTNAKTPANQLTPADKQPTKTGTPPIEIQSGQLVTNTGPLILLNPATVKPGSSVGVVGTGFAPGSTVNFTLKRNDSDQGTDLGFAQVDKGGSFGGFNFTVPNDLASGTFTLVAQESNSDKQAKAIGTIAANNPSVKLGTQVGKPGDEVVFSASGFLAGETVSIYFNSLSGEPLITAKADDGGGIREGTVKVPFGAIGNNSFIFVGDKSKSPITVNFLMLSLYPTITLTQYAAKADTPLAFIGEGFGPNENVRIYLNSTESIPIAQVQADGKGAFSNAGEFLIPFELKGQNTVIAVGEQSQAPSTASFDILPYTPDAQPSTYGGRPGTAITFYANGFARDEVVRIFVGRTKDSQGKEVSCFKTDGQGTARSAGTYTIPGNAQAGQLQFALVGDKTHSVAAATVQVMDAGGPVDVPNTESDFTCQYDQPSTQGQPQSPQSGQPLAPQGGQPQTPQAVQPQTNTESGGSQAQ